MGSARRRHRPAWDVLQEVDAHPETLRLTDDGRSRVARLVGDLRRFRDLGHRRPAGETLYAFLRDTGWLATLASGESAAADEALANVARFFEIVRGESALLADDRAIFLARHLETLIDAGDDPASADPDPDLDAVAVLTVHKAKGLEYPVVFLPGLVAGRFPAAFRREPLALPEELAGVGAVEGDPHLQEERRLFYVAMTRARDELVLTHAADYGGARPRRVSPFVLEALDLPVSAGTPGAGAAGALPLDRLAAMAPAAAAPVAREAGPIEGQLLLSHSVDRRLPDLSEALPVQPRPPRADRAASLARVRLGAPPGGPGVPPGARAADGSCPRRSSSPSSRRPGRTRASSPASTSSRGSRPGAARSGGSGRPAWSPAPWPRPGSSASSRSASAATGSADASTGSTSWRPAGTDRPRRSTSRRPSPRHPGPVRHAAPTSSSRRSGSSAARRSRSRTTSRATSAIR